MSDTNGSKDNEIVPVKLVQNMSANPISQDISKARLEYDSRLYSNVSLPDEMSHYRLFTFFGFTEQDKTDERKNEQLKHIYQWAKSKVNTDDLMQIIHSIRNLELSLGMSSLGETRLDNIYYYINIDNQIKDLEDERYRQYGQ